MKALATDWRLQARLELACWWMVVEKARLLMRVGEMLQMGRKWVMSQTSSVPGNADAPPLILRGCSHQQRPATRARHNSGRQWRLPTVPRRNDYMWSRALLTFGPHS